MNASTRFLRFNGVALLGAVVQLAMVALLTTLGVHVLAAVAAALAITLIHNFAWHRRWTWRDRASSTTRTFVRFILANGLVSFIGNVAIVAVAVRWWQVPASIATLIAIGACGVVNFWLADRAVFIAAARRG